MSRKEMVNCMWKDHRMKQCKWNRKLIKIQKHKKNRKPFQGSKNGVNMFSAIPFICCHRSRIDAIKNCRLSTTDRSQFNSIASRKMLSKKKKIKINDLFRFCVWIVNKSQRSDYLFHEKRKDIKNTKSDTGDTNQYYAEYSYHVYSYMYMDWSDFEPFVGSIYVSFVLSEISVNYINFRVIYLTKIHCSKVQQSLS